MSKDIYKFLISSPCMITGKYESESFKIKTVFPNSISQQKRTYDKDNMNSQRYYVIEMVIESDFEGDENNNGFKEKIFKLD